MTDLKIFRGKKLSRMRHFEKFRGKKLSRMRHFETFRGKKLSRKGPKNAKPRKFLPAKVSDLKVITASQEIFLVTILVEENYAIYHHNPDKK